ncbi:MAG TPA: hypothetical protein PLH20_09500, partial [Flavobacterium sp.]|nr:hypothetical protein [Flavobacterium sp.]
ASTFLFFVSFNSYSQNKDYKHYIENEEVISENKLDGRASFTSFSSENDALKNTPKYYQLLDGVWKFNWVKNPKDRPMTFMNPSENVTMWDNIKVPSNWELQG